MRFISNPSSGKTGYFLAKAALQRGAKVIFITGHTAFIPRGAKIIHAVSAADMYKKTMANLKKADVIIGAAAVGDFSAKKKKGKLERRGALTLKLLPTRDVMKEAGKRKGSRLLIGFSAEAGGGIKRAVEKMRRKNLDMVAYNDISKKGSGFASDKNEITLIGRGGEIIFSAKGPKKNLAGMIIDAAQKAMAAK